MRDPYGRREPGDNQGGPPPGEAATPADGTDVDWTAAPPDHGRAFHPRVGPWRAATPLGRAPDARARTAAAYITGAAGRRSPRHLAHEVAWRYRDAPPATRVTVEVVGLGVVLLLLAGGVFLLVRDSGGTDLAVSPAASGGPTSVATAPPTTAPPTTLAPTTSTTTASTTTTTTSTTTTIPPTTVPPTTAPPTTAPPTTAPPPTAPPTTAPPPPRYDSCWEAQSAGALPLFEGDPGYSRRLDSDDDGEACDSRRDWR
jgi:hypothetical protein